MSILTPNFKLNAFLMAYLGALIELSYNPDDETEAEMYVDVTVYNIQNISKLVAEATVALGNVLVMYPDTNLNTLSDWGHNVALWAIGHEYELPDGITAHFADFENKLIVIDENGKAVWAH